MNEMPESELDKKLGTKEKKQFPLLPELTMLQAKIETVKYEFAMFEGKQQYVTDYKTKEVIYDKSGQPIPRKEFSISFALKEHSLDNGNPRKCWLRVGASLGEKSKLTKLLGVLDVKLVDPTPKDIIRELEGMDVKFQLVNKTGNDRIIYQNVNFDSVRKVIVAEEGKKTIDVNDIQWKD